MINAISNVAAPVHPKGVSGERILPAKLNRLILSAFAGALVACGTVPMVRVDPGFSARAPGAVDKMLLVLRDEGGLRGLVSGEHPLADITDQVKQDLVRAGYSVSAPADLGLGNEEVQRLLERKSLESLAPQGYVHLLEVRVRPVEAGKTPPGFSLGFGGPDPRGKGAPRADALPISCALVRVDDRQEEASARDYKPLPAERAASTKGSTSDNVQVLADDIRSVCHTLLAEPAAPPAGRANATETAVAAEGGRDSEGRKQMKVFNQGNTVILELGPDRRH